MTYRSFGIQLASLFLLGMAWLRVAEAASGIEIAVTPFLPVRTLVQNYEPMRLYLEKRLQRPVIFITAPDYKTFHERTQKQEYNYLITVANAAYLAHTEAGYTPLLRPAIYTRPTLVVAKAAPLEHIADLRGKTIALSDPLAIVSMQALSMLREAGLDPEHDVVLLYRRNHAAAVNYVLSGEVAAAIVSDRALAQMAPAVKEGVRIVQSYDKGAVPGIVYLASPRLSPEQRDRFTRAMLDFVHTSEGRTLMEQLGYGTLLPAKAEDLKFLAPYGAALKQGLAHPEQP